MANTPPAPPPLASSYQQLTGRSVPELTTMAVTRSIGLPSTVILPRLPAEAWREIAAHGDIIQAYMIMGMSRDIREGVRDWLRSLPAMFLTGGWIPSGDTITEFAPWMVTPDIWRLPMYPLVWVKQPRMVYPRFGHSSHGVDNKLVTIGGRQSGIDASLMQYWAGINHPASALLNIPLIHPTDPRLASIETLHYRDGIAIAPGQMPQPAPPVALNIDVFADGQMTAENKDSVTLYGGLRTHSVQSVHMPYMLESQDVFRVNTETGFCETIAQLPHSRSAFMAAIPPGGGIIVAGGRGPVSIASGSLMSSAGEWDPVPGFPEGRSGSQGHVLKNGRFVVFGGRGAGHFAATTTSSIDLSNELTGHLWIVGPLSARHRLAVGRSHFASAYIGGCVFIAGGIGAHDNHPMVVEVYREFDETFRQLPIASNLSSPCFAMGSATL